MRTILFDIDGTLLWFKGVGKAAMERAMEQVWGIPGALDGFSFVGATDGGVARRVAPDKARAPMWRAYLTTLEAMLDGGEHEPLPGVPTLLETLRVEGARLGLLTGNLRGGARLKLGAAGLLECFDLECSAFAEDGDERVEIAAAARRRCGDGPLTVVGDTVSDIRCARHIGARVLTVGTGPQPPEELERESPDRHVPDLTSTPDLATWLLA